MDRQTFDRLMLQHLAAAQRFAVRLSDDVSLAEDMLHDAIVRAATRCESFKGQSKFTTWLFAIIVNVWRDRAGARQHEAMDIETEDARSIDPSAVSQFAEIGALVAARVSSLPPRQREVLVLIALEQLSAAEAAQVLGISEQNVRVNLFHARERLKQELAPYLGESVHDKRRSPTR